MGNGWARTSIDKFILERLRSKNLAPSPPLSPERLIRRVTYDLTGLPPSPNEVDLFLNDRNPDAYEKLVNRLLASPHYGERWALRWLDVVRYADTNGYEGDSERAQAWTQLLTDGSGTYCTTQQEDNATYNALPAQSAIAVLGRNGAGKSTLVNAIAGRRRAARHRRRTVSRSPFP